MQAWWQDWAELIAGRLARRWRAGQEARARSSGEEPQVDAMSPSSEEVLHPPTTHGGGEGANPGARQEQE
jgi:hypothetical protein